MKPRRLRARPATVGLVVAGLLAACSTATEPAGPEDTLPLPETAVTTRPAVPERTPVPSSTTTTAAPTVAETPVAEAEVGQQVDEEAVEVTGPDSERVLEDQETSAEETEPEDAAPTGEGSEPSTDDTPEQAVPPPVPEGELIEFAPGAHLVTMTRTVAPGDRHAFLIDAVAGYRYTVTLGPSRGVWLDSALGHHESVIPGEHPRRATLVYPENVAWPLEVVSTSEQPVHFEITATVRPHGPGPVVYLTFDDGPHPVHTAEVLDVLRRHGARATFFVVGFMVQRFPEVFGRILLEGHTVANHTWNHENLAKLSAAAIDRTIERTQEVLGAHATACLRPPYGAMDDLARQRATEHGLDVIMWSASVSDWLDTSAEQIADYIVAGASDGGIILLHDGGGDRSRTVRGLELALEQMSDQRIRFEPVCGE